MTTQVTRLLKVAGVTLLVIVAFIGSVLGIGFVITFDNDSKIYKSVPLGSDYQVLEDLFERKPEDIFEFENGWSIVSYFDRVDRNIKQLDESRETGLPHTIYDAKVFLVSNNQKIVIKSIYGEGNSESLVDKGRFSISDLNIEQLVRFESELEGRHSSTGYILN